MIVYEDDTKIINHYHYLIFGNCEDAFGCNELGVVDILSLYPERRKAYIKLDESETYSWIYIHEIITYKRNR